MISIGHGKSPFEKHSQRMWVFFVCLKIDFVRKSFVELVSEVQRCRLDAESYLQMPRKLHTTT